MWRRPGCGRDAQRCRPIIIARATAAFESLIAQEKADGLAPPSQADLLRDTVLNGSPATEFDAAFDAYVARRQTH